MLEFLKERGKATLAEVSEALKIPRYGRDSAYELLDSLRDKGLVERVGDFWKTTAREVAETVKEEKRLVDVSALTEAFMKVISTIGREARPVDEWELVRRPMEREIKKERESELESFVLRPDIAVEAKKELQPFPTGTFIDRLFLKEDGSPLNGIPFGVQLAITGLPGSGKSIFVEEVAIKVAHEGKKVLFVTAEDTWKSPTARFDLQSRMMVKAETLKLGWDKIAKNLFVMDTVAFPELRDWNFFAETYRYTAEKEKIDLAIIDSVTILESYRGALKYRVMELCRFNQQRGITAIYVNQRSADAWDTYEMAGGIGLAHNLDATLIIDYGRVFWLDQQEDLKMKRGEFVRIARVLDCRLCNFDRRRLRIDITPSGFVRLVEETKEEPVN